MKYDVSEQGTEPQLLPGHACVCVCELESKKSFP